LEYLRKVEIRERMGKGRAPCCDKSKVKKGPWSPVEDLKLISHIQKFGHPNWRVLPIKAGMFVYLSMSPPLPHEEGKKHATFVSFVLLYYIVISSFMIKSFYFLKINPDT